MSEPSMKFVNSAGIVCSGQLPTAEFTWLMDIHFDADSLQMAKDFINKARGTETKHADIRVTILGNSVEYSLEEFCERLGIPLNDGYRYNGEGNLSEGL